MIRCCVLYCSRSFIICAVWTSRETRTFSRRARTRPKCSTAWHSCWHIHSSDLFSMTSTTLYSQMVHSQLQTADRDTVYGMWYLLCVWGLSHTGISGRLKVLLSRRSQQAKDKVTTVNTKAETNLLAFWGHIQRLTSRTSCRYSWLELRGLSVRQETWLLLTGRAQWVFLVEYDSRNDGWYIVSSDHCAWLHLNYAVYLIDRQWNRSNGLQRSLKVIGNVILYHITSTVRDWKVDYNIWKEMILKVYQGQGCWQLLHVVQQNNKKVKNNQ